MLKTGVVAAALLAVTLVVPVSTTPADAMPVTESAAKEVDLKHKVGRRGRGFRGFRGRGFRGFRGRRFGGLRLRRGFRGRRFYGGYYPRRRLRFRRFYRPRAYYARPYLSYRHYGRRSCRYYKRRAYLTGRSKWWRRYHRCRSYRGYY